MCRARLERDSGPLSKSDSLAPLLRLGLALSCSVRQRGATVILTSDILPHAYLEALLCKRSGEVGGAFASATAVAVYSRCMPGNFFAEKTENTSVNVVAQ